MKKYCCNGTYIELLFNLVPIEFTYVVAYAQWHFILDACVITGFTLFEIALYVSLNTQNLREKYLPEHIEDIQQLFKEDLFWLQRCSFVFPV